MEPNTQQPSTQPQQAQPVQVKSAVAAGLLGIFLGSFGAHNWYLGEKKRGIIHLCLFGGGLVVMMIAAFLTGISEALNIPLLGIFFALLTMIAYIAILGNNIWGLVEGIMILVRGDAGLAAKGYTVAAPAVAAQPAPVTTTATPAAPVAEAKPEEKPAETKQAESKAEEAKSEKPAEKSEEKSAESK